MRASPPAHHLQRPGGVAIKHGTGASACLRLRIGKPSSHLWSSRSPPSAPRIRRTPKQPPPQPTEKPLRAGLLPTSAASEEPPPQQEHQPHLPPEAASGPGAPKHPRGYIKKGPKAPFCHHLGRNRSCLGLPQMASATPPPGAPSVPTLRRRHLRRPPREHPLRLRTNRAQQHLRLKQPPLEPTASSPPLERLLR